VSLDHRLLQTPVNSQKQLVTDVVEAVTSRRRVGKTILFKSDFFDLNQIFLFFFKFVFSRQDFTMIFETGPSAQSHKQHGRHASAISDYTLALLRIYTYDASQHNVN